MLQTHGRLTSLMIKQDHVASLPPALMLLVLPIIPCIGGSLVTRGNYQSYFPPSLTRPARLTPWLTPWLTQSVWTS